MSPNYFIIGHICIIIYHHLYESAELDELPSRSAVSYG